MIGPILFVVVLSLMLAYGWWQRRKELADVVVELLIDTSEFQRQVELVGRRFQELAEQIGTAMVPAVRATAQAFEKFAEAFASGQQPVLGEQMRFARLFEEWQAAETHLTFDEWLETR